MTEFMRRSRETHLLLLLSRVSPDIVVYEKAQDIIDLSVNWEIFTSLSIKHGTAAMVYKNLLRLQNIPRTILDKFLNIYNNLIRANILMISELDRIIDMVNREGVEVISLKGAAASEKIFGDIGIYPSADIDILVKVEDLDKVRGSLEMDGYVLNDAGFDEYRNYFIKELYHINLSKGSFTVEPHWNLFMRYFITPPEFWWEESLVVSSGGRRYRFLSPEKNILYNSFRLFSHAFSYLRFLAIVAEIIRHSRSEIDWEKLFVYAKRFDFENVLSVVLRLSADLLGAPVPHAYVALKGFKAEKLYRCAVAMLLQEKDADNNSNVLYKVMLTILGTNLSNTFRILLRRMFPPMGEIVSRYGLTDKSGKAIVYYLLNPIILLKRRARL